jgi:hypothetical protein
MNPAEIMRKGLLCAALIVGGCSFTPPKGSTGTGASTGSGGTVIIITAGAAGAGNNGQGGLTGNGGGQQCGAVPKSSSKLPPDILIVQDASGSMDNDINDQGCNGGMGNCGANSKWAQITPAINMVVSATEMDVNWGLKFFADGANRCAVTAGTAVGVGPMNAAAITTAIMGRTKADGGVSNGSYTPTRKVEDAASAYLTGLTDMNPKYIVLATDGIPNCTGTSENTNADDMGAVTAVMNAAAAGIPTFVVGVATNGTTADTTLSNMANAGGRPRAGSPTYYPVSSTAEFVSVLTTLVGMATTCTYSVPPPPTTDGTTSRGDISVTGTSPGGTPIEIPPDANNGWTYTDNTQMSIVLHGTACDQVTAGTITTVTIIFNCHVP